MAAMSAKPAHLIFFIAMAGYCAYLASQTWVTLGRTGNFQASSIRLRILRLGNGTLLPLSGPLTSAVAVGVESFGLLRDGCRLPMASVNFSIRSPRNATATLQLDAPVSFNGYFIGMNANRTKAGPVSWSLEATEVGADRWTIVGASVWRQDRRLGSVEYFPYFPFSVRGSAAQGGAITVVNMQTPPAIYMVPLARAFYVIALMGPAVAAIVRGAVDVNTVMAWSFAVAGILSSATAFVDWQRPTWREAAPEWIVGLTHILFAIAVQWNEQRFFLLFGMLAFSNFASFVACDVYLYFDSWLASLRRQMLSLSFFGSIVTLIALILRQRALVHARRLVLEDKRKYDEAWEILRSGEGASVQLAAINEHVNRLVAGMDGVAETRQFNFQTQHSTAKRGNRNFLSKWASSLYMQPRLFHGPALAGIKDSYSPVDSLDQLYVQACILHPVLLTKTRAWAAVFGGYFPSTTMHGGSRFFRYENGVDLKIARVKSVSRAVEKLVRSYAQVSWFFHKY